MLFEPAIVLGARVDATPDPFEGGGRHVEILILRGLREMRAYYLK